MEFILIFVSYSKRIQKIVKKLFKKNASQRIFPMLKSTHLLLLEIVLVTKKKDNDFSEKKNYCLIVVNTINLKLSKSIYI